MVRDSETLKPAALAEYEGFRTVFIRQERYKYDKLQRQIRRLVQGKYRLVLLDVSCDSDARACVTTLSHLVIHSHLGKCSISALKS